MAEATYLIVAAAGHDAMVQTVIGILLGGGLLGSIAAFRKSKPEATLTTLQGMQLLMERQEKDNVRLRSENAELEAQRDACEAHALVMERRAATLELRLRKWEPNFELDLPPEPSP